MPTTQTTFDPTAQEPEIIGDTEKIWLEVFKDKDGDPIMNAAKQLPLKPCYDAMSICVYRITKYVSSYTAANWRDQNNTLNSATFLGAWEAGEAWCEVRWEPETIHDTEYYKLYYTVRCLRGGWKKQIPQAATVYLSGSSIKSYENDDGAVIIGKLDSDGTKLSATDDLIIGEFDIKRTVNFSFIGVSSH